MGDTARVAEPLMIQAFLDPTAFKDTLNEIKTGAKDLGRSLDSAFRKLGRVSAIAGAALGAVGFAAVKSAIDVETAGRKFEAVFRDQAETVRAWSKELGEAFALNQSSMEKWLARAQDLFVPMGLARDQAAGLSQEVVELAANIAVFNGQRMDVALDNIMSGLIGVTRTVRQYGILIDDARVKQKAVTLGMVGMNEELTQQQKVLARLKLMYDDSSDALGRAKDLMQGGFGQAQRLRLALTNLREEVGAALLPILADLTERVGPILKAWAEWVRENQALLESFVRAAAKLAAYGIVISKVAVMAKGLTAAFGGMGAATGVGAKAGLVVATGLAAFEFGKWIEGQFDIWGNKAAEAMEKSAEKTIEVMDKKTKALMEKQQQRRRKHIQQFVREAGNDWTKVWETLQQKMLASDAVAAPLQEAFTTALGQRADPDTIANFADQMLRDIRDAKIPENLESEFMELFKALESAEQVARDREVEARKQVEAQKVNIRINAIETAAADIQKIRFKNLQDELSTLKTFMEKQVQIRSAAFQRIAALRASMAQRAMRTDEFFFGLKRADPNLTPEQVQGMTVDRINELMARAKEAVESGQRGFARDILAEASSLAQEHARQIVSAGESWSHAFDEAKSYVTGVQTLLDDLAKTEIEEQKAAAEKASIAFEKTSKDAASRIDAMRANVSALATEAAVVELNIQTEDAEKKIEKVTESVTKLSSTLANLRMVFNQTDLKLQVELTGDVSPEVAAQVGEKISQAVRAGTAG